MSSTKRSNRIDSGSAPHWGSLKAQSIRSMTTGVNNHGAAIGIEQVGDLEATGQETRLATTVGVHQ